MEEFYYLHTNGRLIWKKGYGIEDVDSNFVKRWWPVDSFDRHTMWRIVVEALNAGADIDAIRERCQEWQALPSDLPTYLAYEFNEGDVSDDRRSGVMIYLEEIAGVDPDEWFDWISSTPKNSKPNFETMPGGDKI